MRLIRSLEAMETMAADWRREQIPVALIPTMGCLHAGHLSLIGLARDAVGPSGQVIVSIYVNPTQFGPREDFRKYPRQIERDARLCDGAGAHLVFAPPDSEIYPASFSTYVQETRLSRRMEGQSRPVHFRGVTTIVAKLFHITAAQVAVFGAKDFQQAAVVKRMVRDLNFPVEIVVGPTVREPGGLALSSRNQYLSAAHKKKARVLFEAIQTCRRLVHAEGPVAAGRLRREVRRLIGACPPARLDYVDFFDPDTLAPVKTAGPGTQMALAVYFGATRLIDNGGLQE